VNRRKVGAVLVLIAAFGLGTVAGGFGVRGYMLRGFAQRLHGPPGRARMAFRVEAMARRLDLSTEQRTKIEKILDAHEQERRALMERCAPDHRTLKDKVDGEIRAVLEPEQQKKFDEMQRTMEKRRNDRRGPRPPG
jgi:Spy/CpxP family protein refolding chaperone